MNTASICKVMGNQPSPFNVNLRVNGQTTAFILDTGADVTVITENTSKRLKANVVHTDKILTGAGGKPLTVIGEVRVRIVSKHNISIKTTGFIIKGAMNNLLGKEQIQQLGLLQVVNSVSCETIEKRHPTLFQGLGTLKEKFKINVDKKATPFNLTVPRRIPLGLQEQVKMELQRMEELGVIAPVKHSTNWCAGVVVAPKKNGKVRLCVDLSQLNKSVKRETYPLPQVDDALASLANAKYFSKMDANCGFWQIKLDPESTEYTTFITPFGRYYFQRMPFGISSAPENFQRQMTTILEGVEGVLCHMDDVLVFGTTAEEHDQRLERVLQRLSSSGLTLNRDKCKFKVTSIEFLGHQISESGITAAQDKVEAVLQMCSPSNSKELKRMLGMVDYMRKFNPGLAEVEAPLRKLLKKQNAWVWGPDQDKAFLQIKQMLSSFPTLVKFDLEKKHRITADASCHSIGAALLQQEKELWQPVAYASRTMTDTEKRYAQIEKEALAVTWACQKFDFYLVGTNFEVETDHKPLVPLLGEKDLSSLPLRIQRFRLRMMRYSYTIFHSPGSQMLIADNLSRVDYPNSKDINRAEKVEGHVRCVLSHNTLLDCSLQTIKTQTTKDKVLTQISQMCRTQWPSRDSLPVELKPFYTVKDEMFEQDGLIIKGDRIVIPGNLRKDILNKIHEGHQGIVKCTRRARDSVWWPGINGDIRQTCENCTICVKFQPVRHQPLSTATLPERAWMELGTDLFEFQGKIYLLAVDYFSRWIEVYELKEMSSKSVICKMKNMFSRFGVPDKVRSDNGGCYASEAFFLFSKEYGFEHCTSSPRYPESNGLAERSVQIIKRLWEKSEDFNKSIMIYRATPLESGQSPAELLMKRKIHTGLPSVKPNEIEDFERRDAKLKARQKRNFDERKRVTELKSLEPGTNVWIKTNPLDGASGTVINDADEPQSVIVQRGDKLIRRNRKHLTELPNEETSNEAANSSKESSETVEEEASFQDAQNGDYNPSSIATQDLNETSHAESAKRTRSGRISKPNPKYQDYVC